MTFTPTVLSKVDANNTTALPVNFTGTPTSTTGYDTIVVTVETDTASAAGGLQIQFADDANPASFTTFYSDTIFANIAFTNTYLVVKQFYRVVYTTGGVTNSLLITTRISPQLDTTALTQNNNISVFDNVVEQTIDAFGKQRVSTPSTLLDIRFPATGSPVLTENELVVNSYQSGTGWFLGPSGGTLQFSATGASPGITLTQSRNFVAYQPGKSLLMLFSGVLKPSNNSYNSAVGLFDTDVTTPLPGYVRNGVYLAFAAGVPSVNITNQGVTTSIVQSAWSVDKFDGSGPSKLTLDFAKCQLLVIDLEWLGVGRVRFGFYAFGRIQYCHQVTHINALTAPYTSTIDLPVSYMLWSTAPAGGCTLTQICSTVISEGGYTPVGRPFTANTGNNSTSEQILVTTTETALLAIRGSAAQGYYHQTIVPTNFSVIDTDNNNTLLVRLRYLPARVLPTVTATTWTSVSPYSYVEYAQGVVGGVANITAFSTFPADSIVVTSNYILGKGTNSFTNLITTFTSLLLNIGSDIENRPDVLLITAQRVSDNASTAKVWASLDWQEVY